MAICKTLISTNDAPNKEGAVFSTAPSSFGFTLIVLMIVVAIIGVLAAIAIPQFSEYRARAFNAVAKNDLRNLMTSEEAYFTQNGTYAAATSSSSGTPGAIAGFESSSVSKNIGYSIVNTASGQSYAVYTGHHQGNSTYAGSETGLMRKNTFTDNTSPLVSAANESSALTSAWGTDSF